MEPRQPYPTDLTDHEWALIAPYVPRAKRGGRPEHYPKREILNGIFYIVRGGCAWRLLPYDFPPWQIVYHYLAQTQYRHWWRIPCRILGYNIGADCHVICDMM